MKKATTILRLPIMEVKDGKEKGTAYDIIVSPEDKKVYLILIGKKPRQILFLEAVEILGIGEDFILIKDDSAIRSVKSEADEKILNTGVSLLNIMAVNSRGDKIGAVKDFMLDEGSKTVSQLILENNEEIETDMILSLCDDYVFVGAIEKTDKFQGKQENSEKVKNTADSGVKTEKNQAQMSTPTDGEVKESTDLNEGEEEFDSPVGLVLTEEVKSDDGEFNAPKGSRITKEMMREAEKHNALLQLAMYAE